MKKLVSTILLLLALVLPAAAEHAKFFGIEINGSQEQFKRKLLQVSGITCVEDQCDSDSYMYQGSYAGFEGCNFYTVEKCGNVFAVVVYLPAATSWRQIKRQYNQICGEYNSNGDLTRTSSEASFEAPYSEGDGDEMTAVVNEKCKYESVYSNSTTTIIVKISKFKKIKIIISDKENFSCDEPAEAYMYFMGLPITGTANEFANRLINEKGFSFEDRSSEGTVLVTGRFAGFDNCSIGIVPKGSSLRIGVLLPVQNTWLALKSQYFAFKNQLKNKYSLDNCDESFEGAYYDGCGNEMEAVNADKCNFISRFNAQNGDVVLTISDTSRICIIYLPN
ncbi:MAG: hypothetical protein ACI4AM_01375 [Muribaculaceae bacterium]